MLPIKRSNAEHAATATTKPSPAAAAAERGWCIRAAPCASACAGPCASSAAEPAAAEDCPHELVLASILSLTLDLELTGEEAQWLVQAPPLPRCVLPLQRPLLG